MRVGRSCRASESTGLEAASGAAFPSLLYHLHLMKWELAASLTQSAYLPGAFIIETIAHVPLKVLLVNLKKNPRNFFQISQFSSDFASYLSALSPWPTPLTVSHRVICLSMGRKLWP